MDTSTNTPSYGVTTDEIMDFLRENMATKEDLKGFAMKEDLERFATKEDLRDFATKEDLGKFKHEFMDYTDIRLEKLRFDIQGDIVTQSRKEDGKLTALIEILIKKNVLSELDAKALLQMEPFPRSMV